MWTRPHNAARVWAISTVALCLIGTPVSMGGTIQVWTLAAGGSQLGGTSGVNMPESSGERSIWVCLGEAPPSNVTVSVSGGSKVSITQNPSMGFTPSNWANRQEVRFSVSEDVDCQDDVETIQCTAPGYTAVLIPVTITDEDNCIIIQHDVISVPEGVGYNYGNRSFNVILSQSITTDVYVGIEVLGGGSTIFVENSSGAYDSCYQGTCYMLFEPSIYPVQRFTVSSGADDYDMEDDQATVRLFSEDMQDVHFTVYQYDDDKTILVDTPSLTVQEGGSNRVRVKLGAPPHYGQSETIVEAALWTDDENDLRIESGRELVFTSTNYDVWQSVWFAADEDADCDDDRAPVYFQAPGWTAGSATITAKDDEGTSIATDVDAVTVPENGIATFKVKLACQPAWDMSVGVSWVAGDSDIAVTAGSNLSFTTSDWDTYKTVKLQATDDTDSVDGQATIRCWGPGLVSRDVVATEEDDDAARVLTNVNSLTVPEGETAEFIVRLSQPPSGRDLWVTLTVPSGDEDITVSSGDSLKFTTYNWNMPRIVTLAAAEDGDRTNGAATIHCAATLGWESKDVQAFENDDDHVVLDPGTLVVPEGSYSCFGVRLTRPSNRTLTFEKVECPWPCHPPDPDIQFWPTSLTFTSSNYSEPQYVYVGAFEDTDFNDGRADIKCVGEDAGMAEVEITEDDNDSLEIILGKSSMNVPEGGEAALSLKLDTQPEADVLVSVSRVSGDTDINASPSTITFTPADWNTFQMVMLTGAEDADVCAGQATIRLGAAGAIDLEVIATEIENDLLSIVTDSDSVSVPEGGAATFGVKLGAQPCSDVTVAVSHVDGDNDVVVSSGSSLAFSTSNWNTYQPVTLTATQDADANNGQAIIRCSATGLADKDVAAIEQDDDPLQVLTDIGSVEVPEGSTQIFQVKLNGWAAQQEVIVTVARTDGDDDIGVASGASLTFTSSTWDTYQTVTLAANQDTDIEYGTATFQCDAAGFVPATLTATEREDDHIVALPNPITVPEGGSATLSVRLNKSIPYLNFVPINVTKISGDTSLVVTNPYILFKWDDWNSPHSVSIVATPDTDFVNGSATFRLWGPYGDVEVTATEEDLVGGVITDQNNVLVPEGETATLRIKLAALPPGDMSVSVARISGDNDIRVRSGASLTFTPSTWDTYQTVTLAAVQDADGSDGTATIRCSGTGLLDKEVTVTEQDDGLPDYDKDGNVDRDDLAIFEACATGPAVPYNPAALPEPAPGCTLPTDQDGHIAADFDDDGDVDQNDFGAFQLCLLGEGS